MAHHATIKGLAFGLTQPVRGLAPGLHRVEWHMRRYLWLMIALIVFPGPPGEAIAPALADGPWRRTQEGWQRVDTFVTPVQYRRPALHPAVVGSLEVLLTMTAMLALSNPAGRKPRDIAGKLPGHPLEFQL
jgi:hypothetical protein